MNGAPEGHVPPTTPFVRWLWNRDAKFEDNLAVGLPFDLPWLEISEPEVPSEVGASKTT